MELSQSELKALRIIAGGETSIANVAGKLKIGVKQAYRVVKSLSENGLVERKRKAACLSGSAIAVMLSNALLENPSIIPLLSDSGIDILTAILSPKCANEISSETGLKKSIVYRKLKQALNISAVRKENKNYALNEKIWPKLKELLQAIKTQAETIDSRVPLGSVIYFKNKKEILFSSKADIGASLTAFSRYRDYGIKLLMPENFYYLPKKKLSLKEIFMHSLFIADKEKDIRHITYIILLYILHKKELSAIKHPVLENIKSILKGERMDGYPSLNEIREKAEIYDIKV